jgi:putative sterol carrier protein
MVVLNKFVYITFIVAVVLTVRVNSLSIPRDENINREWLQKTADTITSENQFSLNDIKSYATNFFNDFKEYVTDSFISAIEQVKSLSLAKETKIVKEWYHSAAKSIIYSINNPKEYGVYIEQIQKKAKNSFNNFTEFTLKHSYKIFDQIITKAYDVNVLLQKVVSHLWYFIKIMFNNVEETDLDKFVTKMKNTRNHDTHHRKPLSLEIKTTRHIFDELWFFIKDVCTMWDKCTQLFKHYFKGHVNNNNTNNKNDD